MHEIIIQYKVKVGQRVIARNKRKKKNQWEPGTVIQISAGIYDDTYRVSYTVELDRRRDHPRFPDGRILTVTVWDADITHE